MGSKVDPPFTQSVDSVGAGGEVNGRPATPGMCLNGMSCVRSCSLTDPMRVANYNGTTKVGCVAVGSTTFVSVASLFP